MRTLASSFGSSFDFCAFQCQAKEKINKKIKKKKQRKKKICFFSITSGLAVQLPRHIDRSSSHMTSRQSNFISFGATVFFHTCSVTSIPTTSNQILNTAACHSHFVARTWRSNSAVNVHNRSKSWLPGAPYPRAFARPKCLCRKTLANSFLFGADSALAHWPPAISDALRHDLQTQALHFCLAFRSIQDTWSCLLPSFATSYSQHWFTRSSSRDMHVYHVPCLGHNRSITENQFNIEIFCTFMAISEQKRWDGRDKSARKDTKRRANQMNLDEIRQKKKKIIKKESVRSVEMCSFDKLIIAIDFECRQKKETSRMQKKDHFKSSIERTFQWLQRPISTSNSTLSLPFDEADNSSKSS